MISPALQLAVPRYGFFIHAASRSANICYLLKFPRVMAGLFANMAQLVAHSPCKGLVAGSTPAVGSKYTIESVARAALSILIMGWMSVGIDLPGNRW